MVSSRARVESSLLKQLQAGPMAFAELLDAADVSGPTARRALRELQRKELVTVVGTRESTGGRPASVLSLNADARVVVGVHLELPGVHMLVTNLAGSVLQHEYISHDYDTNVNQAVWQINRFVRDATVLHGEERVIGIGIASPGYRDSSGTILAIGRSPAWQNVPLAMRLQQETNLLVLIENDVDCMAQAEMELDQTIAFDDFLYLGFTEGVKASLVLNGEIYSGPFGNAGSIGHTTVAPEGPRCTCGNRGCLEAVASVRAIHMAFEQRMAAEAVADERLAAIAAIEDRTARFHAILDAAASGEALCEEVVHRALDYLAIAIANLVNIFQVRLIVLGGALSQFPASLDRHLDIAVRKRLVPLLSNNLTMRHAQDSREYNAAVGAARRFVNEYLTTIVEGAVTAG